MSGLKSYRKYAVNFRLSISSLVSPLASLFLELNIMESKFSVFTSACRQLIASKENVNIEGECSSIDDIKCWISEFEQLKSLTSPCGLRRAEHNKEDMLTPLKPDAF